MQLYGTPLSHFTRKIRILLAELGVPYQPVWPAGVMSTDAASYGANPMLRIPTLVDGDVTLHDSEHIARWLVAKHGDPLGVGSVEVDALNQLAVANTVMANEVVLILAERGGLQDLSSSYFVKLRTAIVDGLAWLDAHASGEFSWRTVATICMWDHVVHYKLVPIDYPRLAAHVARFADRPSVATTTPERLQREAAAV